MGKQIVRTIYVLLMCCVLVGCSKKELSLGTLMEATDFTNIQVVDGNTGWSYAITFVYGSKEVDGFLIIGDNKVSYHNYFYKDLNPSIDKEYLESLFEYHFCYDN